MEKVAHSGKAGHRSERKVMAKNSKVIVFFAV